MSTLDLVFKNLTSDKNYTSKFFERILIAGIKELKFGNPAPSLSAGHHSERGRAWSGAGNIEISVSLVGEARIKKLNNKYRKKNKATDVLSFPMEGKSVIRNSKYAIRDLGDIFICLPFAKNQAKSENVSIEKELARLTVHGFLHLAGYDHERSKSEADIMFKIEGRVLSQLDKK